MLERFKRKPAKEETPSQPLRTLEAGEASIETGDQPLYPGVQRSMDGLKRIIDEHSEEGEVRRTPAGEPVVTGEMLEAWAKEEGYGSRKRGTYNNGETYLYFKHCNLVEKEEDVDKTLDTARHLTSLGAIHPESQWGVLKTTEGAYQLFVVSPKLETWADEEVAEGGSSRIGDKMTLLTDWFKRIDPDFVPGQPIPENSLLHHLSWPEASHLDNWGWDKTDTFFPVDVEVLHPKEPGPNKDYEPWNPKPSPDGEVHFYDF